MGSVIETMEPQNPRSDGVSFEGSALELSPWLAPLSLSGALPADVLEHPLLSEDAWINHRNSGRTPLESSELVTTEQSRAEFLTGAWLIDQIVPPGLGGSLLDNLQPQMLREADVLAGGHRSNAILMPRRSSKTTTLWCILLGRCYLRPVHMAGYSMLTTAKKTTERFRLDIYGPISRKWRDPKTRPVKLINSNGFERVEFDNGSVLAILSPEGDAIRSGAYDTLILDEGGEPEPEDWTDVIASVLPSFDTRGPDAQLVIAGTAGKYRDASHFWTTLNNPAAGRLRYGVPNDIDPDDLETWATVRPLVERIHPGLDGLTTLPIIEQNFHALGPALFAREYLGHFGTEAAAGLAIPAAQWSATTEPGDIPEGVTPEVVALAVHPGGLWASIGVAWHLDPEPGDLAAAAWALTETHDPTPRRVGFKLVHHQDGVDRHLIGALYRLAIRHRIPIVYGDSPQERAVVADIMNRARRKPKAELQRFGEISVAATVLRRALEEGSVAHWPQAPLDKAAATAITRQTGKSRLLGIPNEDPDADITPLEAMALALKAIPATPAKKLTAFVLD